MADKFETYAAGLESPARHAFTITPNDNADFANFARAFYVGATGDVALTTVGGDDIIMVGLPLGSVVPVACKRIKSTGTTASNLVGLY